MRALFPAKKLLAFAFIISILSSEGLAQRVANAACGFSLELPKSWVMHRTANTDVPCWFSITNGSKSSCSFLVRTVDKNYPTTAHEAGFDRFDDRWVMKETWGETIEADSISGPRWSGIEANHIVREVGVSGGSTDRNVWVAVLNAGEQQPAIIEGFECSDERFHAIVRSFRFEKPQLSDELVKK